MKSAFGAVNQSVGCNVFGLSATSALAYPPACAWPAPIATSNLPSVVNAISPTGLPPLVFHDITVRGLLAAIEIPQTPFAAPPHPWLVDVYNVSSIAIRLENLALAGRNGTGRSTSSRKLGPSTCSAPSLVTAYIAPPYFPAVRPPPPPPRAAAGGGGCPRSAAPPSRRAISSGTPSPGAPIAPRYPPPPRLPPSAGTSRGLATRPTTRVIAPVIPPGHCAVADASGASNRLTKFG